MGTYFQRGIEEKKLKSTSFSLIISKGFWSPWWWFYMILIENRPFWIKNCGFRGLSLRQKRLRGGGAWKWPIWSMTKLNHIQYGELFRYHKMIYFRWNLHLGQRYYHSLIYVVWVHINICIKHTKDKNWMYRRQKYIPQYECVI